MPPTKERSDDLLYRPKIDQLKSKVKEIIAIEPQVVPYKPEECDISEILGKNALGTALFQFDPNQYADDPKSLSKVWIERSDEYEHRCAMLQQEHRRLLYLLKQLQLRRWPHPRRTQQAQGSATST